MAQVCYSRLYVDIETISCRLLLCYGWRPGLKWTGADYIIISYSISNRLLTWIMFSLQKRLCACCVLVLHAIK